MSTACAPMPEPASSRLTASDSAREATSAKTGWSMLGPAGIAEAAQPTPAPGGRAPEAIAAMRRRAPFAYRRQERGDARRSRRDCQALPPARGAAAGTVTDIMHTGSWHTVKITADRVGGLPVDADFRKDLRAHVEPFRMALPTSRSISRLPFRSRSTSRSACPEPTSADRSRLHCSRSSSRVLPTARSARST